MGISLLIIYNVEIQHWIFKDKKIWYPELIPDSPVNSDLVLVFGNSSLFKKHLSELKRKFPDSVITGCTTAGEIYGIDILDSSLTVTSIKFERSSIKASYTELPDVNDSINAGKRIAGELPFKDLRHILLLSEGISVNGSELVKGFGGAFPEDVTISGGLAGDGESFSKTNIWFNELLTKPAVIAIGFYGPKLQISYGSMGGWDSFGPERLVTKSVKNELYELDGHSALALYKNFLGHHVKKLPGSALLFPLKIKTKNADIVRTVLSIDEKKGSIIFAGNIPEGCYTRLMKANFDRLIKGAGTAAEKSKLKVDTELAILISCVGRRMVLKQRAEEEIEEVREVLGDKTVLTGFYSYGEISPFENMKGGCCLHNQTMTITTFSEIL